MADPLIVIVFVAAGGAADATTRALERATHDALGLEARLDVHETEIVPTDLDAIVAEQGAHAVAVVELAWADQGRQARLRVHVARTGRWISRTIGFMPSDADAERGRTIGFAVASMLPEAAPSSSTEDAREGATEGVRGVPLRSASVGPLQNQPSRPSFQSPAEPSPDPVPPVQREPVAASLSSTKSIFALDVVGLSALGLDGNTQSVGGGSAAHWFFTNVASLRIGGAFDAGSLEAAGGGILTALVSGGIAIHPLRPRPLRPFGLSAHAGYVLANQSTASLSPSSPAHVTHSRWLSGVDVGVDARWGLTNSLDLLVGLGLQDLLGLTYITRLGARVATLPTLRGITELGLGVHF